MMSSSAFSEAKEMAVQSIPGDSNDVASPLVALHYDQLMLGPRPREGDLIVCTLPGMQAVVCLGSPDKGVFSS